MVYGYGRTSSEKLEQGHPVLQTLFQRAGRHTNITILNVFRGEVAQNEAFASGASSKRWPESKHNSMPSMAVDASPWPIPEGWGDLDGQTVRDRDLNWKERVKFYEMIAVLRHEWNRMCDENPVLAKTYRLRFGDDWDGDGDYRDQDFDDLPHVELVEL